MMNNIPNAKKTAKTTLQKQAIVIIAVAVFLVLGLVFYFAVLPKLEETQASIGDLYPGEHLDESGTTLYMVKPVERKDIVKIEVKNSVGNYVLTEKGDGIGKTFELEDAPGVALDEYSLAGVVVAAGRPITAPADSKNYRAHESATESDLVRYGLDEGSNPNWFRVTYEDENKVEKSYRIVLGNKLPTSANCYAYIDDPDRMVPVTLNDGTVENRYVVYVLDSTSYQTLLFGKTALVGTLIGEHLGNGVYYTKNFEIYRKYPGSERQIAINIRDTEVSMSGLTQYEMVYPGGYNVDEETFIQKVLPSLANFTAEQVMAIGNEIYTPEVYSKYDLDLDKERLEAGTDENHTKFYIKSINTSNKEIEITIYVSDLFVMEDGSTCYFAYVPEQQEIVKLSSETFAWLSWAFGEYVDLRMFLGYIGSLDYFSVLAADKSTDVRFTLTGNPFNHHVKVTTADGTMVLTDKTTGKDIVFDVEYETGVVKPTFKGNFENFRALYYVLITRMLDGTEEPVKVADDAKSQFSVVVQTLPRDRNMQYYRYEGGDLYYEEDGTKQSVTYEGGYAIVQNLTYTNSFGTKVTHAVAYRDEATGKYFVKAKDSSDGQENPKDYIYTDDKKLVPVFLNATDATAEYTSVTYEYKFYDLYSEFTNADGSVTEYLNQTYMLVVPTTTTTVWRIEADGTKTKISEEVSENGNMGSYIRRVSVEKLVSDTYKALNGIEIDEWAVE